jgi:5-methylcytosine-specific restriction endonuclease McrA
MQNYYEHLKDVRWTNKRKRIILRDGKKCTVCNATKNLTVHHTFYYTYYREPWHYPDKSLLTVCKTCHEKYHLENELTFKDPPKYVIKKMFKPRREPQGKKKRAYKGHKEMPSLLSLQAKRLGYTIDRFGKWKLGN